MPDVSNEFLEALAKDPKLIEKLQRRAALDEFKTKYGVQRSTSLKCPACTTYLSTGGSLWGPMAETQSQYVCRKCFLVWTITCVTQPIADVIAAIKQLQKEGK